MISVVCTLFENHFHFGLAALTNSLCRQGFKGSVYAGYRGALPKWCSSAKPDSSLNWPGASIYHATEHVTINFLPVDTAFHFTNYKPAFMLQLLNGAAKHADAIMYFDPDIVINCNWSFFEDWASHGVALVHEIVTNDLPDTHPVRMQWKKIIESNNREITHKVDSYINGGFCGVTKENISFLATWNEFINIGIKEYNADITKIWSFNKAHPFCFLDQDALNITAMCCDCPISEMGPDGMDFIHGGWTMAHAVGSPKPWKKKFIASAFKGIPPSIADKEFWKNANGPVSTYSTGYAKIKMLSMQTAAFMGRFYRRY